ncbi:MAG TPA: hypothetical protein VFE33_17365, partial [Thermoanaerobaculia bacterium]|nr:hypothetical protein [Thermoanaerobaculia bacterium]
MGIVSERSVRVLLHWGEGRRLHVRTEIDGTPVQPDEEFPLGKELSSSYRAFLDLHKGDLGTLGAAVGGAVFPGAHGAAVEALCAAARQRGEGVRLVFETAAPDLLALPFEAARLPGGLVPALEPGVRVLRRHPKAAAPPLVPIPGPLRLLAAVGAPPLRLLQQVGRSAPRSRTGTGRRRL